MGRFYTLVVRVHSTTKSAKTWALMARKVIDIKLDSMAHTPADPTSHKVRLSSGSNLDFV